MPFKFYLALAAALMGYALFAALAVGGGILLHLLMQAVP
jgi:hypothetical protein